MPRENERGFTPLLVIIILLVLGVIGFTFFSAFKNTPLVNSKASIQGVFDINGVIPSNSEIVVLQREANSSMGFVALETKFSANDNQVWSFSSAMSGKSYEVLAQLMVNGQKVAESSPITATAPAMNEVLTFNIRGNVSQKTAIISGTIKVNGYIPEGATITVEGKKDGTATYTTVASNLQGVQSQIMTYSTALEGQSYNVHGILYDKSGKKIGESNVITVVAPAANELLTINSEAQAPQVQSAISGTITLNGNVPIGSSIVIYQRLDGETNYTVALDGISPANNSAWKWDKAISGKKYQMFAALKKPQGSEGDKDVGSSSPITIAAPAQNQVLKIDTGFQLPGATGNITISCNKHDSGSNTWDATVSYQSIEGANNYWLELGTTNGGNDITNQQQAKQDAASQTATVTIKDSVTYYARYAYKVATDSTPQNFSPFSAVKEVKCP